jgi:hypothetical protein
MTVTNDSAPSYIHRPTEMVRGDQKDFKVGRGGRCHFKSARVHRGMRNHSYEGLTLIKSGPLIQIRSRGLHTIWLEHDV